VKLLYFAWVRQKLGHSEEDLPLPPKVHTVEQLAAYLRDRDDRHAAVFSHTKQLRVAVNQEHVGWDAAVRDEDEVAFFPPVTGG
jgi:molybdopterin synthase sulfur carrier subunit